MSFGCWEISQCCYVSRQPYLWGGEACKLEEHRLLIKLFLTKC